MRLLSFVVREDGRLTVAINARLAEAIGGNQYVGMVLGERRMLRGDVARIMHAWLSAWLRAGECKAIRLDTLAKRIWAETEKGNLHKRRQLVRRAMNALVEVGWRIEISGRGQRATANISRPNYRESG